MLDIIWTAYPLQPFDYSGQKLAEFWPELHRGNCETYPSVDYVSQMINDNPQLPDRLISQDANDISEQLCQAWRHFHAGEFERATEYGLSVQPLGTSVACRAMAMYAAHLEEDEERRKQLYLKVASLCDIALELLPAEANLHFLKAFALGRYSQDISVLAALSKGIASKVKIAVDKALQIAPKHAESHLLCATYHAEIIENVGSLVGQLTYGARKDIAIEHYDYAMKLHPDRAITLIEYANGLLMLFGKKRLKEARRFYERAANATAHDAVEALERAYARRELNVPV